jgi:hypothetical protein
MLYEIARETIRRIVHDKILLALVIFGIMAFFYNGMNSNSNHEPSVGKDDGSNQVAQDNRASEMGSQAAVGVDPKLATDFVHWWLTSAMDYSQQTGKKNHEQAFGWMSPQAVTAFQQAYWSQPVADGIVAGTLVAAFQPTSVIAEAVNPDGSVVVGVTGTLVYQAGGQPASQKIVADLLIRRERAGLRVAGLYNRTAQTSSGSVL